MSSKQFKVVIAGEFGSGRSAFAARSVEGKTSKNKIASIKAEVYPIKFYTSAGTADVNLYDTTLHAKGGLPDDGFFRQADACILMYDTTKQSSYDALGKWYDGFYKSNHKRGTEEQPVIVVGTKVDDIKGRDIKPKDNDFARKKGLKYVEISAKANYGVQELYLELAKALMGAGVQFTDMIELAKPDIATVDTEALEKVMKEYEDLSKVSPIDFGPSYSI
ncbi:GTP-binding nuclear protein Ran, partial [Tremellales sp. Uapishka_1]